MSKPSFDPEIADALLALAESRCGEDSFKAALHFSACLASLAPDRKEAHLMLDFVFDRADTEAGPSRPLRRSHGTRRRAPDA